MKTKWTLVGGLFALASAFAAISSEHVREYGGERPAPGPFPEPPPIPRAEEKEHEPSGGSLERDGATVDRFGAQGQTARYRFESAAGEFSIFELEVLGFARGWAATAAIAIRSGEGEPLVRVERAGGGNFALFVPFEAPDDGIYTLELEALAQHYRYRLVRHSAFVPNRPDERILLASGDEAFGYFAQPGDRVPWRIHRPAGEEVRLSVRPAREQDTTALAQRLEAALLAWLGEGPNSLEGLEVQLARAAMTPGPRGVGLEFAVPHLNGGAQGGGSTLRLAPVPDGTGGPFDFEVAHQAGPVGGFYRLIVERSPRNFEVSLRVGDMEDDPLEGVHVSAWLEPLLEPLAEGRSDAEGNLILMLPAGDHTLLLGGPEGAPSRVERVRVRLDGPRELNLVRSEG